MKKKSQICYPTQASEKKAKKQKKKRNENDLVG